MVVAKARRNSSLPADGRQESNMLGISTNPTDRLPQATQARELEIFLAKSKKFTSREFFAFEGLWQGCGARVKTPSR